MKTLDSFNLENVGFIKIDIEGHELKALLGGLETLKKNRPVIVFEEHKLFSGVFTLLKELGYTIRRISIRNDYIAIPA